jgi:fumarate reductase subunit D
MLLASGFFLAVSLVLSLVAQAADVHAALTRIRLEATLLASLVAGLATFVTAGVAIAIVVLNLLRE